MKYSIYQKLKVAGATLLASTVAFFSPSDGRANEIVLDRSNSEELGLSFDKILTSFEIAGGAANESGVILAGVYEEENEVDLQSLDGFSVRVSVDDIRAGFSDIPRNLFR
jgi:hypothetical protein